MSSPACTALAKHPTPAWLLDLLGQAHEPREGEVISAHGQSMVMKGGILRQTDLATDSQQQTSDMFGFKWHQRHSFESEAVLANARSWLVERYGAIDNADWWQEYGPNPVVLDAGCGAGLGAIELIQRKLAEVRYIGADISTAVDVAVSRFAERGLTGGFLQADLCRLPLPDECADVIYSEGVLHHTDSTERALKSVSRHLKHGGRFLFYVYRRKGPIREFSDDYIRLKLAGMSPQSAWDALMPLTKLGKLLGEMNIEIEIPENIDLLEIPAGKINLQRLFYWHIFKAFHRPDFGLEELNHINFDWYSPANAHRQSEEDVRQWCADAGLSIEREVIEPAGITVVARKL